MVYRNYTSHKSRANYFAFDFVIINRENVPNDTDVTKEPSAQKEPADKDEPTSNEGVIVEDLPSPEYVIPSSPENVICSDSRLAF